MAGLAAPFGFVLRVGRAEPEELLALAAVSLGERFVLEAIGIHLGLATEDELFRVATAAGAGALFHSARGVLAAVAGVRLAPAVLSLALPLTLPFAFALLALGLCPAGSCPKTERFACGELPWLNCFESWSCRCASALRRSLTCLLVGLLPL